MWINPNRTLDNLVGSIPVYYNSMWELNIVSSYFVNFSIGKLYELKRVKLSSFFFPRGGGATLKRLWWINTF